MDGREQIIRSFDCVIRGDKVDDEMVVSGYALLFDKEAFIGNERWGFKEKINKRALDKADLKDVVFNLNHNSDNILARTGNGSLELIIDGVGLKMSAKIIDTVAGRDTFKLIQSKLVSQMSFMAHIKKERWVEREGNKPDEREILSFDKMFDVSAVVWPAYKDTTLAARDGDALDAGALRRWKTAQMRRLNSLVGNLR